MKKSLIPLLLAVTVLVSCGAKAASYKTDVSVDVLADAVSALLPAAETITAVDDDYITYMMELDLSGVESYTVRRQASGSSIDEYAVIKMPDEASTAAMKTALEAYLVKYIEAWNPCYDADQFPKAETADVRIFGCYVVYAIISEADRTTVYTAIENLLKI